LTRSQSRYAVLALTVQSAVLGYNWVVMKVGLQYADTWSFAALRFGLGALVLLIALVLLRRPVRPYRWKATVVLGLLQTTLASGLLMWALEEGAVGRVSALVYTMPFWSLLFAWVFLGERLRRLQWVALGPAVAGLVLIIDPADLGGSLQSKLLAIGAGVAWGASAVWAKKMLRGPDVDVLNLSGWQMLFGSIPLVIVALVIPSAHVEWTEEFIGALAYNVFIATALAWLLWLYVIKLLPAGLAGMGTLLTPVIGIAASMIQTGERLEGLEGVGIALILGSLFLLVLEGALPKTQRAERPLMRGKLQ
jgi:drug/metabolite transporter (DMT)-like permease